MIKNIHYLKYNLNSNRVNYNIIKTLFFSYNLSKKKVS